MECKSVRTFGTALNEFEVLDEWPGNQKNSQNIASLEYLLILDIIAR